MNLRAGEYYWIGGTGDFGSASSYNVAISNEYFTLILWPADEDYVVPYPGDPSVTETLYVAMPPNIYSDVEVENGGTITGSGTASFLYLDSSVLIDASTDASEIDIGVNAPGSVLVAGGTWNCSSPLYIGEAYAGTLSIAQGGSVSVGQPESEYEIVRIGGGKATSFVNVDDGTLSATGYIDVYNGTLTISNGGVVLAPDGVQVPFAVGETTVPSVVLDGGTIAASPNHNALFLDATQGLVTGWGLISGDVLGEDTIVASGGTLTIDGDVSDNKGVLYIADRSELQVDGTVGVDPIVEFATANTLIYRELGIAKLKNFGGLIEGFQAQDQWYLFGDTIDLEGVIANDATFNPSTGVLTLYNENWGTGNTATPVGTLDFTGISISASYSLTTSTSFALSSDASGGTDVTVGVPTPDIATLAAIADEVYTPGVGVNTYSVVSSFSDPLHGFFAEEFQDGNQVVVAIKGTDPSFGSVQNIINIVADSSWATGSPNALLTADVADAASFLNSIRLNTLPDYNDPFSQYENITITGHSLGGAVAQLLGAASHYTAVGFNAPGTAKFLHPLSEQLRPAFQVSDGLSRINYNYRLHGDQVSLAGTQIGTVFTVESPFPDDWWDVLNNHSMDNVLGQISAGATLVTTPDAPLSLSDLATEVPLNTTAGQAIYAVSLTINLLQHYYGFDPSGDGTYELTESSSSPAFSSIVLPVATGVSTYSVSFLRDGSWTSDQAITPGTTFYAPSGDPVTGISFTPEDSNQDIVNLSDGLIFGAAFASTGTFDGTLTEPAQCFCRGTRISTALGAAAVEDLQTGDEVVTASGELKPIIWIGHRHIECRRHPRPEHVWPVCVRAHGFDAGRPHRDLWLSPDHAVFVDGMLIPIRQLINGTTIVQVPTEQVTYFHVELSRHDVLTAEGLPVESYLDTGNRAAFANAGTSMMLHPDFTILAAGLQRRDRDVCAPFVVRADQVEPVWKRLATRATELGYAPPVVSITTDAKLRLEAGGHVLWPLSGTDGAPVFVVPPDTEAVRLVSRAAAPSGVRPWLDDRRRLGIAVGRIKARCGTMLVEVPVDHPALGQGWHDVERAGGRIWRWTDGNAYLPIPPGTTTLELVLAGLAGYPATSGARDNPAASGTDNWIASSLCSAQ